ncbi:MAG: SO_0444 family Cu/Zn efflux transporter [Abditibacteriota bacterium]|nr:SO_0444 family Cu/Zn efflux transporter [Abditibacteriota bacterium]
MHIHKLGLGDIPAAVLAIASQMAPYLLLGFLLAGVLRLFLSPDKIKKYLGGSGAKPVFWAALLGVPIPLCSCGILPVAASLRKSGAGKGPVAAFLLSTPQTGIDNIIATYGMLGWTFALWRPIQAFIMGLLGGNLIRLLDKPEAGEETGGEPAESCCCEKPAETCSCEKPEETCCCEKAEETCSCEKPAESCCCEKPAETCSCEKAAETCSCDKPEKSCCCKPSGKRNPLVEVLSYAFVELPSEIGGHLILGLVLSGIFVILIELFHISPRGLGLGSQMALCILMGIPLYVCSTASIPIAFSFLSMGFDPGAVLVFMVTGPETNLAALTVLLKLLGGRGLAVYLLTLVVTACLCGWLLNGFLNFSDVVSAAHSHGFYAQWAWGAALFWLLLAGFLRKNGNRLVAKPKKA